MTAPPDTVRLIDWLLAGLRWKAQVYHVGQYCGRWTASTAGHGLASFHVVLRGRCHLHRPGEPSQVLEAGDAVFLLSDLPHHLSSEADPHAARHRVPMQPTQPANPEGTALACGFFHFEGHLSQWLFGGLGTTVLMRHNAPDTDAQHAAQVFALMQAEADRSASGRTDDPTDVPSPLLARLTVLLFHYALRHALRSDGPAVEASGLWALVRQPDLAPLLARLMEHPEADWSVEHMARSVHMSRAKFFRLFTHAAGEPPAQFLQRLRMQLATHHLMQGEHPGRVSERVGYQSLAAFTRVYTKVMGQAPGAFTRQRHGLPSPVRH